MNRRQRLSQAAGQDGPEVAALASLPASQVDTIARLLREARRSAVAQERQARKARRSQRRRHRWTEDASVGNAVGAMIARSLVPRASESLEALTLLDSLFSSRDALMGLAVDGLRSQGYSDAEIGAALGVSRQRVGQRFGTRVKHSLTPDGRTAQVAHLGNPQAPKALDGHSGGAQAS